MIEKKLWYIRLLGFYGELLTDYQKEISRLYLEEDLSLGEISEQLSISRQAIHDNIKRTQKALNEYENKLGMLARYERQIDFLGRMKEELEGNDKLVTLIEEYENDLEE